LDIIKLRYCHFINEHCCAQILQLNKNKNNTKDLPMREFGIVMNLEYGSLSTGITVTSSLFSVSHPSAPSLPLCFSERGL